jgi:hypothetical protein
LTNENGERIGTTNWSWEPQRNYAFSRRANMITFSGVDANKITDRLTVSIAGVNGMSPQTAGEQGYMSISTEDFVALAASPFKTEWSLFGIIEIIDYTGPGGNLVIPSNIYRRLVSFRRGIFQGKHLTSVIIPDSVTSVGESAFANNRLTSVTLPAKVQWDVSSIDYHLSVVYYGSYDRAGTYVKIGASWRIR